MRLNAYFFAFVIALAVGLSGAAAAPGGAGWQTDVRTAQQMAAQSNRLVLVYFEAPWCEYCRKMERETLVDPSVLTAIGADYVPVRLNAVHNQALVRQLGVGHLPTTVLLTPQGQVVDKLAGYVDAATCATRLAQVAAARRTSLARSGQPLQASAAPQAGPPSLAQNSPPAAPLAVAQPTQPPRIEQPIVPSDPRGTALAQGDVPPPLVGPMGPPPGVVPPQGPPASPATAPPAGPPLPLGLEGYCPVELVERKTWTLGDRQWSVTHAGRTYLLAGPEQQRRFLADPNRYSPVFSGNDIVMQVDRGQTVTGQRRHGVFFCDRVYLFSSEESLQTFARQPDYYDAALRQAVEQAQRQGVYR